MMLTERAREGSEALVDDYHCQNNGYGLNKHTLTPAESLAVYENLSQEEIEITNDSLNRAIAPSDPLTNDADLVGRNAFEQYIAGFLSAPLLSPAEEVKLSRCLSLARDAMDALA